MVRVLGDRHECWSASVQGGSVYLYCTMNEPIVPHGRSHHP
ncbi:MAG: hypothetical protein ACFE0I_20105 [Elainellaceae cyanobacterium]